tara:strand:+ start:619 stop:1245 length:627 start_codon:yes stop_codon:yes gene_type:complete
MGAVLTKEDIKQLHTKLVVPVAVSDILNYGIEVEPEMQYGLHEALSDIDPDSALLAIALSAQHIAGASKASFPIANALYTESAQILNDYGPEFIRDLKRGSVPEENFLEVLQTVPEDLEAMADLLDALCADMEDELSPIAMIATLLSIQARAHMEITLYILEEAGRKEENTPFSIQDKDVEESHADLDVLAHKAPTDNIILFPANLRN